MESRLAYGEETVIDILP